MKIDKIKPYDKNAKIERICKTCGLSFKVYKSHLEKSNASGNFCKRACYNIWLKTRKGNLNNHYSERIKISCEKCRKDIYLTTARKNAYKHHFCSKSCRALFVGVLHSGENNSNWQGGHIKRKGNFNSVKSNSFSKIQFCAICGSLRKIHIHHIVPFRYTQDNSLQNLIPLCISHHRKVEVITNRLFKEKLSVENIGFFMRNILRDKQQQSINFIKQCLLQI